MGPGWIWWDPVGSNGTWFALGGSDGTRWDPVASIWILWKPVGSNGARLGSSGIQWDPCSVHRQQHADGGGARPEDAVRGGVRETRGQPAVQRHLHREGEGRIRPHPALGRRQRPGEPLQGHRALRELWGEKGRNWAKRATGETIKTLRSQGELWSFKGGGLRGIGGVGRGSIGGLRGS